VLLPDYETVVRLRAEHGPAILPITRDARGDPIPNFYGLPRDPESLLFDLRADPREERNLAEVCPEKLAEMLDLLERWRAEMAEATGEPDPILEQGLSLPYERFMARLVARR
jgi:hypothetical protein